MYVCVRVCVCTNACAQSSMHVQVYMGASMGSQNETANRHAFLHASAYMAHTCWHMKPGRLHNTRLPTDTCMISPKMLSSPALFLAHTLQAWRWSRCGKSPLQVEKVHCEQVQAQPALSTGVSFRVTKGNSVLLPMWCTPEKLTHTLCTMYAHTCACDHARGHLDVNINVQGMVHSAH